MQMRYREAIERRGRPHLPALEASPGGRGQHVPHRGGPHRGRRGRRCRPRSHHEGRGEARRIRVPGGVAAGSARRRPIFRPTASASTPRRWSRSAFASSPRPTRLSPTRSPRSHAGSRASTGRACTGVDDGGVAEIAGAARRCVPLDLAAGFGRETRPFKLDVRKLKNLGLTLSLDVGYRLSPRARRISRRSSRVVDEDRAAVTRDPHPVVDRSRTRCRSDGRAPGTCARCSGRIDFRIDTVFDA